MNHYNEKNQDKKIQRPEILPGLKKNNNLIRHEYIRHEIRTFTFQ